MTGRARALSIGRLEQLVTIHGALLRDARRNSAFQRALAARVRPGCAVLDIGAGTGLWAIVAARLGAGRVVAVEKERLLVPLIEALASENGVADRVRAVCGDSRRLALGGRFDVVVSETVGNQGFEEDHVAIMADARRRFLRRGGAIIPETLSLLAAPVAERARVRRSPIRRRVFDALAVQFPRSPAAAARLRLLGRPAELLRVDLRRAGAAVRLERLAARWRLRRARRLDGVAVWVAMRLAPGIRLDTLSGTHWSPTVLGIEPRPCQPANLTLRADLSPATPRWEVGLTTRGRSTLEAHAPLFAYGWIKSRLAKARG
jgi:protein arginine N-methyltransferase 1